MDPNFLFQISSIDRVDPMDIDLSTIAKTFKAQFGNSYSSYELQQAYHDHSKVISKGLFHRILTDPKEEQALNSFKYLDLLVSDYQEIGGMFHYIAGHKNFGNLKLIVKTRLIWLLGQFTPKDRFKPIPYLENTFAFLIRQLSTPNTSHDAQTLSLTYDLLDVIESNLGWFGEKALRVIPIISLGLLRLIPEHCDRKTNELKEKEIKIVIPFLRNHFGTFLVIGRDFIRALQDVMGIPEFQSIWRDMNKSPERLAPSFRNLESQLMIMETPVEILGARLSPEMEHKLFFIVKGPLKGTTYFGLSKSVGWTFVSRFKKKYLNTLESQRLIPDIIRYILSIDIKMEGSSRLSRFEIIKNLLLGISSEFVLQQAKLALFYDWIYYTRETCSVHRLEPVARLLKDCALKPNEMGMACCLIEFLYLLTREYEQQKQLQFLSRIKAGHNELVNTKVILTISEYRVDDETVNGYLEYLFSGSHQPLSTPGTFSSSLTPTKSSDSFLHDLQDVGGYSFDSPGNSSMDWSSSTSSSLPLNGSLESHLSNLLSKATDSNAAEPDKYFQQFLVKVCEDSRGEFNPICIQLMNAKTGSEIADYIDGKKNTTVATALLEAIVDYQQCLSSPTASENLLKFCHLLSKENIMFGLALWTFLIKEYAPSKDKISVLFWFFQGLQRLQELASIESFFEYYFNLLFDTSLLLFYNISPLILEFLPQFSVGNVKIVDRVIRFMDPFALESCCISLQSCEFSLFGNAQQTKEILITSLSWGTFEQYSIWQLLQAECSHKPFASDIVLEMYLVLQKQENPEAMTGLLSFISQLPLTVSNMNSLLMCPQRYHGLFTSTLVKWHLLHGQQVIHNVISQTIQQYKVQQKDLTVVFSNLKVWKQYYKDHEAKLCDLMKEPVDYEVE